MSDVENLKVVPLRAFKDNYIWVLRKGRHAAVVDPGEARPVLGYLQDQRLELCAVLLTHHHADHIGGVADLLAHSEVPVYAPRGEPIDTPSRRVAEGDEISVAQMGLHLRVLDLPGHTRAHVGYYGANCLFCGDTLFACGCGRIFEGTPQQMFDSLEKLAALPRETLVFSAHEYTLSNIEFAKAVEPGNAALLERARSAAETRKQDRPTLPTTIGLEKETNPFLRSTQPEVMASADKYLGKHAAGPIAVFAAIRDWKNKF